MSNAIRLLYAIHEKTGGRDRGVRDVTELETGLTAKAAREAWHELLDQGLIERFNQQFTARLSFKGIDFLSTGATLLTTRPATARAPSIVIARGADTVALKAVSNFLAELDLESVALQGPGLMQKVETHHHVSFAVVLLTAEDLGENASRHVLMDLGYLMGRFGSNRVCAFAIEPGLDMPEDFAGLSLHPFDTAGIWKPILAEELRRAGFTT